MDTREASRSIVAARRSASPGPIDCPCGARVPATQPSCPSCHRLLHAEELRGLAAEADRATEAGDLSGALGAWRRAHMLLPPGSKQHQIIHERIDALSRRVDQGEGQGPGAAPTPVSDPKHPLLRGTGKLGAVGLLAWKLKWGCIFLLTKVKFLFLGLTKVTTLVSMLLALGVYWTRWGLPFALGIVVSIYIHEMGHVAALRRFGIKAGAPFFIPGLGALVLLQQHPQSAAEDARIGLAGPIWGLFAAIAAYAGFFLTGWAGLAAIARAGAWINLFNLLPIWQLDGGRGFRALTRRHRWLAAGAIGAMLLLTGEGLLWLLLLFAVGRALSGPAPTEPHQVALRDYVLLLVILSAMTRIPVPGV